jgi:23S rRNA pseudouridine1911/1915/1917 synthase
MQEHSLPVSDQDAGSRLDAFIAASIPGLTRSQVKKLIERELVRVDGKLVKPSHELASGSTVRVSIPPPVHPSAVPESIPLDILYEDADIVVVNKPAGLVVHPAAGHASGTLVNALLAHCRDLSGIGGELKPGIVHRLDVGTSGVIIAAKNDRAHLALSAQFAARTVEKVYGALVIGSMREERGSFDDPIGRSRGDRKRISSHTSKARTALTEWRVLERFGSALTWVEVTLHTGRTHQIRVHFSESGHPLAGDPLYGGERKSVRLPAGVIRDAVRGLTRPALHAWRLALNHPESGERMRFEAPLPEDIEELLESLRRAVCGA